MAKETAEQKLLKLIEATDSQEKASAQSDQPSATAEAQKVFDSVKSVGVPAVPLPSPVSNVLSLLSSPASLTQVISNFGLKEINKIMMIGILCIIVFFSLDFSRNMKLSAESVYFAIEESIIGVTDGLLPTFKDISEYVAIVSRRNIFHPFERKVVKQEEVPEELKGKEKIVVKIKDLKLVGISWLDTPESASAMIENTTSGVTQFLKMGDRIQGVTIKTIYSDSIVVGFEGEEMEMQL